MSKPFIIIVIVLQIGAATSMAWQRDWKHMLYWLGAAGANIGASL